MVRRRFLGILIGLLLLAGPTGLVQADDPRLQGSSGIAITPSRTGTQTVVFELSETIDFSFGYCNPLTCGNSADPEFDCYVGLNNPNFLGERVLTITPPVAGIRPRELYLWAGPRSGAKLLFGYYRPDQPNSWNTRILEQAPIFAADGSIRLELRRLTYELFFANRRRGPVSGRVCGLNDAEKEQFYATYGRSYDNRQHARLEVTVVWEFPTSSQPANPTQTLQIGTQSQPISVPAIASVAPPPEQFPAFRQDDKRWGGESAATKLFAEVGTIPTVLASLLAGYGTEIDPATVGRELKEKGISWETGPTLGELATYLQAVRGFSATEGHALSAVTHLAQQQPVVVAWTDQSGDRPAETLMLLTNYDAGRDRFTALDPRIGKRTIIWNELMEGAPWFLLIGRP